MWAASDTVQDGSGHQAVPELRGLGALVVVAALVLVAGIPRPAAAQQDFIHLWDKSTSVAENGGTFTQYVWLNTAPTAEVTVQVVSGNTSMVTVHPETLTFNADNYSTRQEVTYTGVDDDILNSPPAHRRTTVTYTASGGNYAGLSTQSSVIAHDDEPIPFTVVEGRSYTLRVSIIVTQGCAPDVVSPTSSDPSVLTVDPPTLTWTEQNSGTQQLLTVTFHDNNDLGDGRVTLQMPMTRSGSGPSHRPCDEIPVLQNVVFTVKDDDTGKLTVDAIPACGTTVTDMSVTPSKALVLDPAPSAQVATEYRVISNGDGRWLGALPIEPGGRSIRSSFGTFAELRRAYAGFEGFEYRLRDHPDVTAQCIWEFDDGGTTPIVWLTVSPNPVNEGSSVTVTATLSAALSSDRTIPLTLTAGTAESGDFSSLSGIAISAGSTSGTGTISTTDDADADDETFTVALSNLPPSVTAGSPSAVEVTIRDNDGDGSATPTVWLSVSPNPVNEGSSVTVTATLSAALSSDVTIPLTQTAGTAEPGDYGTLSSITIGAGATSDTGTISTTDDADADDETFTVALNSLPSSVTAGSPSSVEVTIRDDDGSAIPTVQLSVSPNPVDEGDPVTVSATLSAALSSDVTIPLTQTAGTAEAGDFGSLPSITISAGSTSGTGTISTTDDADADDETFTVALSSLPSSVTAGSPSAVEVTIRDGDGGTTPAVWLSVSPNPVDEGDPVTVSAMLSAALSSDVTIPLMQTAGTAEVGDFGSLSSITIGAGATSGTGTISTTEDTDADDETFTVALNSLPSSLTAGSPSSVEVTIRDTTMPNQLPRVSASCDPCKVSRGGEVRLTATALDPDGDPLAYAWSAPRGGFTEPVDKSATRWRAPAETGQVTIRVRVSDGRGGTASATVSVEVVNTPPVFGDLLYTFELPENEDGRRRPVLLGAAVAEDPDGDEVTYAVVEGAGDRFVIGEQDGAVAYVGPGEDFETVPNRFTLTVHAQDRAGADAYAEVVIEVTGVNERPVAADDDVRTVEDKAITVDVLANDMDPDGDRLQVTTVSAASNGTAYRAADGGVTYMPAVNWHGVDIFTYVVSDGEGLTATATVQVTVQPVNDAPVAIGAIPDQMLDEGGPAVDIDLSLFFGDEDGDMLTYSVQTSDSEIVKVATTGTRLTLTPGLYGSATVTVTAEDPGGLTATQTLRVGVSDRLPRAILENLLAATARNHLASVRMALGQRIGANRCEPSRLSVRGRSVPLGWEAATAMLEAARDRARVTAPGAGLETPPASRGLLTTLGTQAPSGGQGIWDAIDRTEFLLSLGGGDQGRCSGLGRWSVWGQGDVQRFEGTPEVQGYTSGYDADLSTGYVGMDAGFGEHWLVGVALSRSRSVGDWHVGTSNGELTQTMDAIYQYLRWRGGATSVWVSMGLGRGNAENLRGQGRSGTSSLDLRLGLVELKQRFGAPGGVDFSLLGDAAWAALQTGDGAETLDGQDVRVHQIRIGADLSLTEQLGRAALTPFGHVYVRRDGGAGQTGSGIEVATGLRTVLGIVRLEAQARMLALHSAAGYGEQGAALTLTVGRQGGEGFALSVSPRWGDAAISTGALWNAPLGRGPQNGHHLGTDRRTLNARASYGIKLPSGRRLNLHGSYSDVTGVRIDLRIDLSGKPQTGSR